MDECAPSDHISEESDAEGDAEWYERMEAAGGGEQWAGEEAGEVLQQTRVCELSEEEYFLLLEEHAMSSRSAVALEESHALWGSVLQMQSSGGWLGAQGAYAAIAQWLLLHMPAAVLEYNIMLKILQSYSNFRNDWSNYSVWVSVCSFVTFVDLIFFFLIHLLGEL